MAEYKRLSPEFALLAALESVPGLAGAVSAMQPKKDARPPFAFYLPGGDGEEETLDGWTGLQSFSASVHLVAATYQGLLRLCLLAKAAVRDMRGLAYETAEEPQGAVLIERAVMEQSSPDLFEAEVGYYRRMHTVRLDYQTEEVLDNDD